MNQSLSVPIIAGRVYPAALGTLSALFVCRSWILSLLLQLLHIVEQFTTSAAFHTLDEPLNTGGDTFTTESTQVLYFARPTGSICLQSSQRLLNIWD
mmetsp:Transcript_26669/g.32387  ORF Transcript_26669/g.32387 Transcript_26669/m.32387 type:complete len:97 (+) Transcript_26669:504-794(+)